MGRLADPDFALKFRDIIRQLVKSEIRATVPKARFGIVQGYDRSRYTASVLLQGDKLPVNVRMGSIQPSAVGQVVRVDDAGTQAFISDVIGGAVSYNMLDTGFISVTDQTYITPTTGATVTLTELHRIGNVARCYFKFTTPVAITVPADGNIGNLEIGILTDSRFIPDGTIALASSFTGPQINGGMIGGSIQLTSVAAGTPSPIPAGTQVSLSGTYLVASDITA